MSEAKLKPCPKCGSVDTHLHSVSIDIGFVCYSCGNKSDAKPTREEAVKAWNEHTEAAND
jgi:Lar family restriction alleviation protein